MATSSSFKQQCPSCEAMVPIRDPGLIGKKIDCPKCKYRFLVEEPAPEEDEEGAESEPAAKGKSTSVTDKKGKAKRLRDDSIPPDEDEEGKAKAKTVNTKVLYAGIGLGVVALVALIGGGILLFGGGGAKPPSGGAAGGGSGGPQAKAPASKTISAPAPPTQAPQPVDDDAGPIDDLKNIFPNDTAAIFGIDLEKALASSLKKSLLETPGSFADTTFKRTFDFTLENVKHLQTAIVPGQKPEDAAFFSIMKVEKPFNVEFITKSLKLVALPEVNGLKSFSVNGDLDTLSAFFLRLSTPPTDKLSVHFIDGSTMVLADAAPLKKFLEDKRHPQQQTQPPPPAPDSPQTPAAPAAPLPNPGTPGGIPPIKTPIRGKPNQVSDDGTRFPGVSVYQQPATKKPGPAPAPATAPPADTQKADPSATPAPQGVEAEPGASSSYLTIHPSLKIVIDRIERDKAAPIVFVAAVVDRAKVIPSELTSLGAIDKALIDKLIPKVPTPEGTVAIGAALHEFSEVKASGLLVLQSSNSEQAKSAKLWVDYGAESAASLIRREWEVDVAYNRSGNASGGGATIPIGQPVASKFNLSGAPGGQQQTAVATGKDGMLATSLHEKTNTLLIDINLGSSRRLYEQVRDGLDSEMIQMKGLGELVASRPRIHELARAVDAYLKAKGTFPRGAAQRPPSSERGIDWYPDQRLSWMVELLPYLGDGEFKDLEFEGEKSWTEGKNQLTAQVLIPQFLSPGDPKSAHVRYPGRVGMYSATRFVGVAGLGLDAASYRAGDPSVAKKIGIFGYDRVTKIDDIHDDAENTIAILQVPSGQITPWMAGGGATIRGISEGDDALKPFICAEYKGKKGTFAIMADAKVRFIPEDTKPAVFRGLCTIAGGERREDINDIAPLVPEDAASDVKSAPTNGSKPESTPPPSADTPPVASKSGLPTGWKEVLDEVAGFSVGLPPGVAGNFPLPDFQNVVASKSYGVNTADGGKFVVWQLKLSVVVPSTELPLVFAAVKARMIREGKPGPDKPVELDGNRGMEWPVDLPPAGKSVTRCYVAKDQVYVLVGGGPKTDPKDIQTFLDSFHLLKK